MSVNELTQNNNFDELLSNSENLYAIVDFYAPWCKPCKEISNNLGSLASKYNEITFIKINVDEYDEFADKYQVSSLPTILVFATKTKEIEERLVGCDSVELEKICKKYE
jgi:thioredoxin 1